MRKSPGNGALSLPGSAIVCALACLGAALCLAACAPPPAPVSHCWVQLFARTGFDPRSPHDIFFGPGTWPSMTGLPGAQLESWQGQVQSLITGPRGHLFLWPRPEFAGPAVDIPPGRQLPVLEARGVPPVGSMRLECR